MARQQFGDLRANGGESRVAPPEDRRVGGQSGQQRELLAQRVVHGQRPLGAAHRHVHLQRAHQLAPGCRAVLIHRVREARTRVERPLGCAEGVNAGGRRPRQAVQGVEQNDASGTQIGDGCGYLAPGRCEELYLRGRHFELEAPVVGQAPQHLRGASEQLERVRLEQHHLLLEPHGEWLDRVERLPEPFDPH